MDSICIIICGDSERVSLNQKAVDALGSPLINNILEDIDSDKMDIPMGFIGFHKRLEVMASPNTYSLYQYLCKYDFGNAESLAIMEIAAKLMLPDAWHVERKNIIQSHLSITWSEYSGDVDKELTRWIDVFRTSSPGLLEMYKKVGDHIIKIIKLFGKELSSDSISSLIDLFRRNAIQCHTTIKSIALQILTIDEIIRKREVEIASVIGAYIDGRCVSLLSSCLERDDVKGAIDISDMNKSIKMFSGDGADTDWIARAVMNPLHRPLIKAICMHRVKDDKELLDGVFATGSVEAVKWFQGLIGFTIEVPRNPDYIHNWTYPAGAIMASVVLAGQLTDEECVKLIRRSTWYLTVEHLESPRLKPLITFELASATIIDLINILKNYYNNKGSKRRSSKPESRIYDIIVHLSSKCPINSDAWVEAVALFASIKDLERLNATIYSKDHNEKSKRARS